MREIFKTIGIKPLHIFIFAPCILGWMAVVILSGSGWNPAKITWDFSNPGAFGDSFGPLSAIMASIAAIGAIAAYKAQSQEIIRLKERQEEQDDIAMSDRARAISREFELDKRSEKSSFESTFFKLLDSFRSLVSSIDVKKNSGESASAHDAFEVIVIRLDNATVMSRGSIPDAWQKISNGYKNDLNHYFRFMYHLVRYVHESSTQNKYFYVRLLRAMLCESEIILLALNCIHGEGRDKFKFLVEEYSLLHNLSAQAHMQWEIDGKFADSAFQRAD